MSYKNKIILLAISFLTLVTINSYSQTTVEQKLLITYNGQANGTELKIDYLVKGSNLSVNSTLGSLNADIVYDSSVIRYTGYSDQLTALSSANGYNSSINSNSENDSTYRSLRISVQGNNVDNSQPAGYNLETSFITFFRLNFIILDNTKKAFLYVKEIMNQVGFFVNNGNQPNTYEINNITLSKPENITDGALPVTLKSFISKTEGRNVILNWITASELNNKGFNIERMKIDGKDKLWNNAGFMKGYGNKNTPTNYSFSDNKLNAGKYQYRLQQVDNNGDISYHKLNTIVEIGIPASFNLTQNYPNPFNPVTKIDYDLPSDSKVSIKVYDIAGRMVMDLVNANQTAGNYSISLNANYLSSGIYFYRLIANASNGKETVISKKMTVLK